jgi:hypothetical protein
LRELWRRGEVGEWQRMGKAVSEAKWALLCTRRDSRLTEQE